MKKLFALAALSVLCGCRPPAVPPVPAPSPSRIEPVTVLPPTPVAPEKPQAPLPPPTPELAPVAKTIAAHLQDISVTIHAGDATGSGVIFTRRDATGNTICFVWTAGHLVAHLRSEREVVTSDGIKRTLVEFADATIVKFKVEDGRGVGATISAAEVIRYSAPDTGEDLAILRIREKGFTRDTVGFYSGEIPQLGTELFHVGSLLGDPGANSMTTGVYSQIGRMEGKTVYDQTSVTEFPGSSGGGIFLRDGRYVGMLVQAYGPNFNLIVPIRRMRDWARSASVTWALDPNMPMPVGEMPVEDIGHDFK